MVRAEYFSDTNTSTYAVPDTYCSAAAGVDGHGGLSTSFKPYGGGGVPTTAGPVPGHPRDIYVGGDTPATGLQVCNSLPHGQFTLYSGMLCFVNKIVKILYLISLFNIVVFCVSTTVGE